MPSRVSFRPATVAAFAAAAAVVAFAVVAWRGGFRERMTPSPEAKQLSAAASRLLAEKGEVRYGDLRSAAPGLVDPVVHARLRRDPSPEGAQAALS